MFICREQRAGQPRAIAGIGNGGGGGLLKSTIHKEFIV